VKLARSIPESGVAYYSDEVRSGWRHAAELEQELRGAVEAEQLLIHYQPRIDMTSGKVVGAEALYRWQHPTKGLVGPSSSSRSPNRPDIVVPMGAWVLDRCLRAAGGMGARERRDRSRSRSTCRPVQFAKDDLLRT
jgi:EAL domain-containing protein (putative c-di-GMP-specific phosphodiesterase class I)